MATLATLACGCFTDADGRQPDPLRLYYPTGLVASPGRSTLYVANSDFDLAFSGGSVQAIDLAGVRRTVSPIAASLANGDGASNACATVGLGLNPDPWLNPGPCAPIDFAQFVRSAFFIGAFASGLALVHEPDGPGARLFTPVRGDPSITYFEVDDDRDGSAPTFALSCLAGGDGFCSPEHRIGQDPERSLRGIQLPADPVGIAASRDGEAIVSAHQTQSAASLVVNGWGQVPYLSYFSNNLATGPTEVVSIPEPSFVPFAEEAAAAGDHDFRYLPGFAISFRSAAEVDIVRYVDDSGSAPPRPFLVRAAAVPVNTNSTAFDSRGLVILDRERRDCEQACDNAGDPLACRLACAEEIPLRVYLANRNPASLLVGRVQTLVNREENAAGEEVVTSASETLSFFDVLPLNFGPSRVEIGQVVGPDGVLVERVFAVCFDSRAVFIIDPYAERVEAVVRTGRGPHDIAIDSGSEDGEPYAYLHVGHFTDSYIGVVDLDLRRPTTYGQIVANLGIPTPPEESR